MEMIHNFKNIVTIQKMSFSFSFSPLVPPVDSKFLIRNHKHLLKAPVSYDAFLS